MLQIVCNSAQEQGEFVRAGTVPHLSRPGRGRDPDLLREVRAQSFPVTQILLSVKYHFPNVGRTSA